MQHYDDDTMRSKRQYHEEERKFLEEIYQMLKVGHKPGFIQFRLSLIGLSMYSRSYDLEPFPSTAESKNA